MKKVELLAPVGNMEKFKMAIHYGADAVFLGGKMFNLRAGSSNFSDEELEEAVTYAHDLGKKVYDELKKIGINSTLINPRFITGIDEEMLYKLLEGHELVITLEDGVLDGGFGEKISRFYSDKDIKVLNFGAKKEFVESVPLKELYERYHLTEKLIIEDIMKIFK